MIQNNYLPNQNIVKTGLTPTFQNISASQIQMSVSAGEITGPWGTASFAAPETLALEVITNLDNQVQWLLVKDGSSYEMIVTQRTFRSRGAPILPESKTFIVLLGEGRILAGHQEATAIEFVVNQWV